MLMKKTIVAVMLVLSVIFGMSFATSAAPKNYTLPKASTPPTIDGKGNDEAWKNSFELTLNPSQALKNGGFVLNRNTTSGVATAKINGVWGDKGLYFKWVVDDPTFGWVTDIQSKFFNNMDGVQLFIDPFNRGSKSYKGNSFCFDFVGFTSQSGVGQVPVHKPSWAEHWQWDGNNAYADVQIASTIVTEKDTSEYNRIEIVKSYTIEVFLPWKSLNINAKTIEDQGIKPNETTIGIGFALIDYRWDAANFNKDNIDKSQIVVNFCTDFGEGKDRTENPVYYNKMVLADSSSQGGNNGGNTSEDNGLAALQTSITAAEEKIKDESLYSAETVSAVKAAVEEAKKLNDKSTKDEVTAAKNKLDEAVAKLVLVNGTIATYLEQVDTLKAAAETDNKYTEESWNALLSAYDNALPFKDKDSEAGAEEAKQALINAISGLQLKDENIGTTSDKSELEKAIDAAEKLEKDKYTEETWNKMQQALTAAKEANDNDDAVQLDVDNLTAQLKEAMSALELVDKASADAEENSGLPMGAVIGIIIGAVVVVAAIIIIIVVMNKKKAAAEGVSDTDEKDGDNN